MNISKEPNATETHRILLSSSTEAPTTAPDLVGKVSLAITSPPYHNAIDYEQHAEDATKNYRHRGDINYANEYLSLMTNVWDSCWEMLRPGGYLVINAGTVLEDGYHYPLPQDLLGLFPGDAIGFHEGHHGVDDLQFLLVGLLAYGP